MAIITQFQNIYIRMAELGIRQNELAEMMGMSPAALSRRMTGRAPWTLPEMQKLLDILGLPEETLDDYFGRSV